MKKPNIVLITIDCLRGDFVNEENTPNLLKLVDKYNGFITTQAYTAGMATSHAFRSILGGIYPLKYGPKIGAPKEVPMLAEVLKKGGYRTIGINAGNPMISSLAGYNRGFDIFADYINDEEAVRKHKSFKVKRTIRRLMGKNAYSRLSELKKLLKTAMDKEHFPVPSSRQILSKAMKAVRDDETSPFFLWIHLMDVHEPYLPERKILKFRERLVRGRVNNKLSFVQNNIVKFLIESINDIDVKEIDKIIKNWEDLSRYVNFLRYLYAVSLKRLDVYIYEFIMAVENVYRNTSFIITSDHGQEFFEHGMHGHLQIFHNKELCEIPFLFLGNYGREVSENITISNLDIGPTCCFLANENIPSSWEGEALFENHEKERVVFTQSLFPNTTPGLLKGKSLFSDILITAHKWSKPSTTVLCNKVAPTGSYSSRDLELEAKNFYHQTMKKFSFEEMWLNKEKENKHFTEKTGY